MVIIQWRPTAALALPPSAACFGSPTTIFISSSGKIVGRYIGQLHAGSLRSALREAFHA
jgi:hypothetical protein